MRLFVFLMLSFFSLALAGDEFKEVTEQVWVNPDGSIGFSLALVKILADTSKNDSQYIFQHHGKKQTIVTFDPNKNVFTVKKNFQSASKDTSFSYVPDPTTGERVKMEW